MFSVVTFQDSPVKLLGKFPQPGERAKKFSLVSKDLTNYRLDDYSGKIKVLNIFPSIDTGVCASSVRRFNMLASNMHNTIVLCISSDLPFAQSRFCDKEGLTDVVTLSTLRGSEFKYDYGVQIADGILEGLTARAVVALDEDNHVIYSELVTEIINEPDYDMLMTKLAQHLKSS
ncbi:thiol peroxidase [Pantoea dispersa]|uniref:thiol peroxidase n=1 Tax=Pantoea dispersa TaxID=59814 RepID=UPI0039B573DA